MKPLRARVVAVAVMVLLLAAVSRPLTAAGAPPEPHENPDTAPRVIDPVLLLQHYSAVVDYVLAGDAAGVARLQAEALWANIPAGLKKTVGDFLSSGRTLAQLIPAIETNIEAIRTLQSQSRLAEAAQSSAEAAWKLGQARRELRRMNAATVEIGVWAQVELAPPGSRLRRAYYEELEPRLVRLQNSLDLLSRTRQDLTQQLETTVEQLQPTVVTLSAHPGAAFVGESIEFWGTLTADGKPLPGSKVTILLDGATAAVVEVGQGGTYRGELVLPYHYEPTASIQARYYPQGANVGLYLGSSSSVVSIEVLFYETSLSIAVPGEVNPGGGLTLEGELHYSGDPIPESRSLRVYWDGELAAEAVVKESFTLELPVAEDTAQGKHQVAVQVTAQNRYAPARAETEVEVTKTVTVIEVDAPGMVLLPFELDVKGKVYSVLGPLQDASVKVTLGDREVATVTRLDGTFAARLSTGLSLTLVGSQELRVWVVPREPWHQLGYSAVGLLVINPVNIGATALILAAMGFFTVSKVRRRTFLRTPAPIRQPAPALLSGERVEVKADIPETKASPEAILLSLYRGVLRLVQRLTAVMLSPSQTLREFTQQCAPLLGPLAGYLQEFTLLIERVLYSRHLPGEAEVARGSQLSQGLREGTEDESI